MDKSFICSTVKIYNLTPRGNLNALSKPNPREGALLCFNFGMDGKGFADCHPWVELGDLPLTEQLSLLRKNKLTQLTERSLYFARIDAQHRLQNKNVFAKKVFPNNHFITFYEFLSKESIAEISLNGFRFIKLKYGKNLKNEIEFIKNFYPILKDKNLKLRLDFNSSLTYEQSLDFFSSIKEQIDVLDFVEDPCPYEFAHWQKIQGSFAVSLALDRKNSSYFSAIHDEKEMEKNYHAFHVLIIKPAIESMAYYLNKLPRQRIVFTSYMDHPLGQLCAMYDACSFYKNFPDKTEDCGLLTHLLYTKNSDLDLLKTQKSKLIPPSRAGFGIPSH